jgi:glycosyltransferase involved in cell wall biosynthesis
MINMNIIWFSGRHFGDLCATTQKSLAKGLVEKGHDLTFVNPDSNGSHNGYPWNHQGLTLKSIPGLKSIFLARKMRNWLNKNQSRNYDMAILDWRIAHKLVPLLETLNTPWILMDRSPPADGNILSSLQWYFWKRSWKLVKNHPTAVGCVVSDAHKKFIIDSLKVDSQKITIVPAGVETQLFRIGEKTDCLQLTYHGRLDGNRGLQQVIAVHSNLIQQGFNIKLNFHGKGNMKSSLEKFASNSITITGQLSNEDLSKKSSNYDIGFLPMPDQKVWRLASPLKRSEYLACGMIVIGIDHSGHAINGAGDWLQLFDQTQFVDKTVEFIKNLEINKLRELQKQARLFAESNLDWSVSVDRLNHLITQQS